MATTRKIKTSELPPRVQPWDEFVAEAEPDVESWQKGLPDGTVLTIGCPTSDQLDLLGAAQAQGDVAAMVAAIFTTDADKVMELTRQKAFTVRLRLINDVMFHYGMSLAKLPESSASSN